MKTLTRLLSLLLCFNLSAIADAADKPVKVKPSKVSAAKGRDREKLFTEWLPERDFQKAVNSKADGQLIYYEYHEGKDTYRGIFSKAISFNGWWRRTLNGEKEMEQEVNSYKSQGYEPLFVVLERNFYSMIFVKPDQLEAARRLIAEFGVEPPVVK